MIMIDNDDSDTFLSGYYYKRNKIPPFTTKYDSMSWKMSTRISYFMSVKTKNNHV